MEGGADGVEEQAVVDFVEDAHAVLVEPIDGLGDWEVAFGGGPRVGGGLEAVKGVAQV